MLVLLCSALEVYIDGLTCDYNTIKATRPAPQRPLACQRPRSANAVRSDPAKHRLPSSFDIGEVS